MSGQKILVVDDDRVILRMLQMKLKASGYEVLLAQDPAEGMAVVRSDNPDLIILDINFPPDPGSNWDGFGFAEWMHHTGSAERRPLVFITGDDIEKHKDHVAALGGSAIFQKPFDLDKLLEVIAKFLGQPGTKAPASA